MLVLGNNSTRGNWTTEGCQLMMTNGSTFICECNHLTNFAVLVVRMVGWEEGGRGGGLLCALSLNETCWCHMPICTLQDNGLITTHKSNSWVSTIQQLAIMMEILKWFHSMHNYVEYSSTCGSTSCWGLANSHHNWLIPVHGWTGTDHLHYALLQVSHKTLARTKVTGSRAPQNLCL